MTIRIINGCNKWGKEQGLINSYQRINGGSDYDPRDRVLTKNELDILFSGVTHILISLFDLLTILGLEAVKYAISRVKLFSEYIIQK